MQTHKMLAVYLKHVDNLGLITLLMIVLMNLNLFKSAFGLCGSILFS